MKKKRKTQSRSKTILSKKAYVRRPSQITRAAPSKRLRKRRRKNITAPTKGRFPNPRPLLFIVTAKKGSGKKMHFDGKNFSERPRVKTFGTMVEAEAKARQLLKSFPILRTYKLFVEPNKTSF